MLKRDFAVKVVLLVYVYSGFMWAHRSKEQNVV